jgi:DNA-binding CsgD family transcriptional regulator
MRLSVGDLHAPAVSRAELRRSRSSGSDLTTRLRAADLEAVLSFLEQAQTVDGPAPFTTELLDLLTEIVGCAYATFTEVDHRGRVIHRTVLCSADPWNGEEGDGGTDEWWESPRTVALSRYRLSEGAKPLIVLSDFFSRGQRTSADFNPNFQDGVSDEISLDLDPTRAWFACLSVASDRDFGDRERLLLHRLHPHLIGLYRTAELRRRLGATAAAFDPDATERLTRREREVMHWVADGLSNAEIARVLVVERSTVRKHLEHIYEKLGVRSRTAALARLRASRLTSGV